MPYSVSFREGILFRFNLITNSLIFSDSRTNSYYLNITVKDSSEYSLHFQHWNPKSWPFLGRGDSPKIPGEASGPPLGGSSQFTPHVFQPMKFFTAIWVRSPSQPPQEFFGQNFRSRHGPMATSYSLEL